MLWDEQVKLEEVMAEVVKVDSCTVLDIGKEVFKGSFTGFEYKLLLDTWLIFSLLGEDPNSGREGSDPNSRAPNWTFNPVTSADPGISTAEAGILEAGGILRFGGLICFCCV